MANNYPQNMQTQQMPQHSQQYQQYQQQQQYQPRQSFFQEPPATTTGQWMLTLFLVAIPIVNIILLFVWAFGSSTEASKKNWARATLIWALIGILLIVVLVVVAMMLGINIPDQLYYVRIS